MPQVYAKQIMDLLRINSVKYLTGHAS